MLRILPNHIPKRTFRNCEFIADFLHTVVVLHQRLAFLQQLLVINDLRLSQRSVNSKSGIRRALLYQTHQMVSGPVPHAFGREGRGTQRLGDLQKAFVAAEQQRIVGRVSQRLWDGEEIGVLAANELRICERRSGGDAAQRLAAHAVPVMSVCL